MSDEKKIVIASDHTALDLKKTVKEYLSELGYVCEDLGPFSDERTDYPIYGKLVGEAVSQGKYLQGILICGTGVGISLAANKIKGIRAVVCSEPYTAKLSKEHNNTNVLAFGARVVGSELAKMIVKEWLEAKYEGGRHAKRVDLISEIENDNLN